MAALELVDPVQIGIMTAVAGVFGWLWAKANGHLDMETMGGAMAGGAAFIMLGFVIDWTNGAPWDWGAVAAFLAVAAVAFVASALVTLAALRGRSKKPLVEVGLTSSDRARADLRDKLAAIKADIRAEATTAMKEIHQTNSLIAQGRFEALISALNIVDRHENGSM